jgi:hypothetical protein
MHHPQLLIYEGDGRLAAQLRPVAEGLKWVLRQPRQLAPCLQMLRRGGPGVLVIKVGHHLEGEFTLLERVSCFFPDTGRVVIGDAEHAWLTGLAWDLGADCVLLPPLARELLSEVVTGLMAGNRELKHLSAE